MKSLAGRPCRNVVGFQAVFLIELFIFLIGNKIAKIVKSSKQDYPREG
jgi:hypothetical protein